MKYREPHCCWCGKARKEVEVVLEGPGQICLCSECVIQAHKQIDETIADRQAHERMVEQLRRCACCTPAPIAELA